MMGMHGEAWVNTAIQEADLLLAFGMRFDDRVTGNLKTYAPQREEDPHRDRSGRSEQERPAWTSRSSATCAKCSTDLLPHVPAAEHAEWLGAHHGAQGRFRGPRHPEPARQRAPLRGARHQRSLARDRRQRDRRHRRRPAPDVGGAVLQAQHAALAHHVGRPRHDGLRAAGGHRRQDRAARRGSLGRRRRRRLPDDDVRAGDGDAGETSTSTSRSSTTATSAWCGSGRSSSTRSATPPRRW